VTHIRRDVMVGVLTGGLLVSSCGDDRHGTTGGSPIGGTPTSGAPTGAAGQAWLTAIQDFNGAMNDFAKYYRDDYRSPVPDDFDGRDPRFAFLFERQDSLMTNLDYSTNCMTSSGRRWTMRLCKMPSQRRTSRPSRRTSRSPVSDSRSSGRSATTAFPNA